MIWKQISVNGQSKHCTIIGELSQLLVDLRITKAKFGKQFKIGIWRVGSHIE